MSRSLAWFTANRGWTAFILTPLVAAAFLAVAYAYLREESSLVAIEVTAEYVVQKVARPELATLPLANFRQTSGAPCHSRSTAEPVNGVLRPDVGVIIHYRWSPERIAVLLVAPDTGGGRVLLQYFDDQGAYRECALTDRSNAFVLEINVTDARARAMAWPLPIAGPAQVGAEIGSLSAPKPGGQRDYNILVEGQLQVYGRAVRSRSPSALIPPMSEPLAIPAGSRLASGGDPVVSGNPAGAPWYGLAFVAAEGFRISATTEAAELHIYRPGPGKQHEVVEVGLFTALLSDPSLAFLSFGFIVLVAVGQLVCGWVGVWQDKKDGAGG